MASLHQAVLRKFEDDFIKVVKADHELRTLLRKEVIHQEAQMDIERARTDKAAREILFEHLFYSGNLLTLKTYCKEIIEAKGLPLMQDLGRKMMAELEEREHHPVLVSNGASSKVTKETVKGDDEVDTPMEPEQKPKFVIITANDTEKNVAKYYLDLGDYGRVCKELEKYNWKSDPFLKKKKVVVAGLDPVNEYELFTVGDVVGVHVKCHRIGPRGASETTKKLLNYARTEEWPLKVIFIVGCCGASLSEEKKKEKNWRGTVLLSDQIRDYLDSGKETDKGVDGKSREYSLCPEWLTRLSDPAIIVPTVDDKQYRDIPVKRVDKYVSGPFVVKSEAAGNKYRADSEMVGIEMEGTDVYTNVKDFEFPLAITPKVAVVKGISDYGGTDKNEDNKSLVFCEPTKEMVGDKDRQEIATFHAITLVVRCIASNVHHF